MINDLLRRLKEEEPSRELDCCVHEVLTGELDENKTIHLRQAERAIGRMLVDRGSERLFITVPKYTAEFIAIAKAVPAGLALRITMDPPEMVKQMKRLQLDTAARWAVSLHNPLRGDKSFMAVGLTDKDERLAIVLCAVLVGYARGNVE